MILIMPKKMFKILTTVVTFIAINPVVIKTILGLSFVCSCGCTIQKNVFDSYPEVEIVLLVELWVVQKDVALATWAGKNYFICEWVLFLLFLHNTAPYWKYINAIKSQLPFLNAFCEIW